MAKILNVPEVNIAWLAGDGSDRCYYRIHSPKLENPLVLMQLSGSDAVALRSGGYDWIKIASLLADRGLFVPRVIATMPDHAALIIEDYGNQMLEGRVFAMIENQGTQELHSIYKKCMEIIAKFLAIPATQNAVWCHRAFDADRFAWELNFFIQKYAIPISGIDFSTSERAQFDLEVKLISETLAANSYYFVHRDFHSRNVMVKDATLAVIDFQDARLGPASYDLVSLCFDSYVPFDAAFRTQLMKSGLTIIREQLGEKIHAEVDALWRPMLLQRQLKAIGSFGYLTLDKKRNNYLKYVEPALATLEAQNLQDERWPLISDTLIRRLRRQLDQR